MACQYTYKGKTYSATEFDDVLRAMQPAEAAKYMPGVNAVPSAPFVGKTEAWSMLAMKRMIRYGVENGFDKIAWTTGTQQADRYDLSKQLWKIAVERGWNGPSPEYRIDAWDNSRHAVIQGKWVSESELADTVGKDLAEKIANNKDKNQEYSGLDLKVGGEGMIAFYDQMLPQMVNKYVKKWGGRVGETVIEGAGKPAYFVVTREGQRIPYQTEAEATAAATEGRGGTGTETRIGKGNVHSLDITDSMRESVMQGQPLFSRPSIPPVSSPVVGDRFTIPGESQAQRAQRKLQDEAIRWTTTQDALVKQGGNVNPNNDVAKAIERYPGRVAAKIGDFTTGVIEPLMKRIVDADTSLDEVSLLAYAQHAPEVNREIAKINPRFPNDGTPGKSGSGMTDKDAADIIAQVQAMPNGAKIMALADDFRDMSSKRLDMLVASGVMEQSQADAYRAKYKFYVPLKGFEQADERGAPQGSGQGLSTGKRIDFRRLGRSSRAADIFQNIHRDYEIGLMLAEKAEVGRTIRNLVRDNPDDALWTIDTSPKKPVFIKGDSVYQVTDNGVLVAEFSSQKNANAFATSYRQQSPGNSGITVAVQKLHKDGLVSARESPFSPEEEIRFIENGKEVRIQLKDDLLLRSYNRLWHSEVSDGLRLLNMYNGMLRQFYTQKNPAWFVLNVFRDVQGVIPYVTGEHGLGTAMKIPGNLKGAFGAAWNLFHNKSAGPVWNDVIKRFRDNGGYTGFSYVGDIEAKTLQLNGVIARYMPTGEAVANIKAGKYKKGFGALGTKLLNTRFFAWIEAMNTTFENMTRLAVFKAAIDSGLSDKEAGSLAKNASTNFNRRGEWGPNMNATWLFANAGIQGTRNVGHALFFSKNKEQVWALMGGLVAMGVMAGMLSDDDDDAVDDAARSRSLTFKFGDSQVSIPMPYGFGFFAGLGQYVAQAIKHPDKRDKIAIMLADLTASHFSPVGNPFGSSKGIVNILPTMPRPVFNAMTNVSPFGGGPLYPENQFDKSRPDSEKAWRGTRGSAYDVTAKWLNEATGGDVKREGIVSVSPESLKLSVSTLFGGVGKLVSDVFSMPVEMANDNLKAKNVPIVKQFYRTADTDAYLQRFYEQADEADKAYQTYRGYIKAGMVDQARSFAAEEKAYVVMGRLVTRYRKQIKEMRDTEDAIKMNDKLSSAEKNLRLSSIDAQKKRIVVAFNDRLKAL